MWTDVLPKYYEFKCPNVQDWVCSEREIVARAVAQLFAPRTSELTIREVKLSLLQENQSLKEKYLERSRIGINLLTIKACNCIYFWGVD